MLTKDSEVTPKKSSAKKSPKTKKTTQASKAISTNNENDRQKLIAVASYYRAEKRGFNGSSSDAVQDWLAAEMEMNIAMREMQIKQTDK